MWRRVLGRRRARWYVGKYQEAEGAPLNTPPGFLAFIVLCRQTDFSDPAKRQADELMN